MADYKWRNEANTALYYAPTDLYIPMVDDNSDYQDYLRWVAEGNHADAFVEDNDWDETLRLERNEKLAECDWTQTTDSVLSAEKKAEWATYRQQLRDMPETVANSETFIKSSDPVWPTKPS